MSYCRLEAQCPDAGRCVKKRFPNVEQHCFRFHALRVAEAEDAPTRAAVAAPPPTRLEPPPPIRAAPPARRATPPAPIVIAGVTTLQTRTPSAPAVPRAASLVSDEEAGPIPPSVPADLNPVGGVLRKAVDSEGRVAYYVPLAGGARLVVATWMV